MKRLKGGDLDQERTIIIGGGEVQKKVKIRKDNVEGRMKEKKEISIKREAEGLSQILRIEEDTKREEALVHHHLGLPHLVFQRNLHQWARLHHIIHLT